MPSSSTASKVWRQALLYGSSIALMKGLSLLLLPFVAQQLSADEFGRLELASSLAVIGSILIGLGLEDALYRFVGEQPNQSQRHRLAACIYSLTLLAAALIIPTSHWLAPVLSQWVPGQLSHYEVQLVLLMLAFEGAIAVPLGWLRMRDKAVGFFTLTTGRAALHAALTVWFLSLDRGVAGILEAGLLAAVLQALLLGALMLRDTGLAISAAVGAKALVYGLPLVASGLLAFTLNGLDRWIAAEHTTLTDVAHLGIAAKFALATVLLLQPYGMWWMPKRFEVLFGPQGSARAVRFNTIGVALALIITVAVGLTAPLLIDWLMPAAYAAAAGYALVLVATAGLKEITELLNLGCLAGRTTGVQVVLNAAGACAGVVCMLWLTPNYGVWGAVWALFIAQAVRLALFIVVGQRLQKLPYRFGPLLALAALACGWLLSVGSEQAPVLQLLLATVATLSTAVAAVCLGLIPLPDRWQQRWSWLWA
ncbi:oligosaccharide translocase [Bacterioplanes sanyensis]|uniref:Oligosaccharide translocase n=2 Tax=Bacterioplanes sanyensis TaxID=1249553 RepID=A0A222FR20_9GAMM|nr:oligosaccharide translocase [Bacterioplanes sanyensis]